MSGTLGRTVYAGTPVGLAPRGRAASVLPLAWPNANVGEALDYTVDFSRELAGGTDIVLATATVAISPSGSLVASAPVISGLAASFALSGGLAATGYVVTVSATLASGKAPSAQVLFYVNPALVP
ncbi:hypothetical protein [Acidocella sp.]|uniref:phage fiber-tail adaptor protein n=1 Tax=Acidocella sp. TaxID=50710 RepID=UPI002614BF30|nr:hypothetical protein [Acidocella sp.]MDD2794345.1 hypothetical protein [Acidocella sp.]